MAKNPLHLHEDQYAMKAIQDRLYADLKDAIKKPVMEMLEKDVDAAIERVASQLEIDVQAYMDVYHMRQKVVIDVQNRR